MVTTLKPNARDTPTSPMPTCGKPAAMTALPHPAKVSQNVPIASAAYFFVFMWASPLICCRDAQNSGNGPDPGVPTSQIRAEQRQFCRISWLYLARAPASQVDIPGFVWYMPALRVKGQAFRQPFASPEFLSDQLKDDAACRFSSAITMSIKPSRR